MVIAMVSVVMTVSVKVDNPPSQTTNKEDDGDEDSKEPVWFLTFC